MNPITTPKPIWKSKVFWWSIAKGVAALLAIITTSNPTLQTVGWVGMLSQLLNIALRYSTTAPIV